MRRSVYEIGVLALALVLLGLVFAAVPAGAAVVWAVESSRVVGQRSTTVHRATVTSDADGAATGSTTLHGYVLLADVDPQAAYPTDGYDCVLTRPSGADVFGTGLQDLTGGGASVAGNQRFALDPGGATVFPRVYGTVTLTCANMGDTKAAVVRVVVEE